MQRRAGLLGEVLAGDREVDAQAVLDCGAGVARQAEDGMGNALLDRLGGELGDAGVHVPAERAGDADGDAGEAGEELLPVAHRSAGDADRDRARQVAG